MLFVNISNHPHTEWPQEQVEAAKDLTFEFCETEETPLAARERVQIVDVPFPEVKLGDLEHQLFDFVAEYEDTLRKGDVFMVQGEFAFCYLLVSFLLRWRGSHSIIVSAHTKRMCEQRGDKRIYTFKFEGWNYYNELPKSISIEKHPAYWEPEEVKNNFREWQRIKTGVEIFEKAGIDVYQAPMPTDFCI